MTTDYDRFAHLRRQLPNWWMEPSVSRADVWSPEGVTFQIARGEETWRCIVSYSIIERMVGGKLTCAQAERIWMTHGDDFKSAAMRSIKAKKLRTTRIIRITLSDVIDIELD
jgi:hypothetical protein